MGEAVSETTIMVRTFQVFIFAFVVFAVAAKVIGPEKKEKWFKRREKYTFFNRRGIFGEFINFGYPRTIEGIALSLVLLGVIFGFGYWYLFIYV